MFYLLDMLKKREVIPKMDILHDNNGFVYPQAQCR
jgi:hypothetical protein